MPFKAQEKDSKCAVATNKSSFNKNYNHQQQPSIEQDIKQHYNPLTYKQGQNKGKSVIQGYFRVRPDEYTITHNSDKMMFATNHLRIASAEEARRIRDYVTEEYEATVHSPGLDVWRQSRTIGEGERRDVRAILDGVGLNISKALFDATNAYDAEVNPDYNFPRDITSMAVRKTYSPVVDIKFFGRPVNLFMDEGYQFAINAETTQPKECYMKADTVQDANQKLEGLNSPVRLITEPGNAINITSSGVQHTLIMVRPNHIDLGQHDCEMLSKRIAGPGMMQDMQDNEPLQIGDRYFLNGNGGVGRFAYHYAAIVASSPHNNITLENYSRSTEINKYMNMIGRGEIQKGQIVKKLSEKIGDAFRYPKDSEERINLRAKWNNITDEMVDATIRFKSEFAKAWYFSIYGQDRWTTFQDKWAASQTIKGVDENTNLKPLFKTQRKR